MPNKAYSVVMDLSVNLHPVVVLFFVTAFIALRIIKLERFNRKKS